jgi:hypothetical protein
LDIFHVKKRIQEDYIGEQQKELEDLSAAINMSVLLVFFKKFDDFRVLLVFFQKV